MKLKSPSGVKIIFYILCFFTLVLPMNYRWHSSEIIFGFHYISDLFNIGEQKEEVYWFFYYFILYLLPPAIECTVWFLSKRKIFSDVCDIVLGTGSSVLMFCFFVSLKKSPIGIFVAMLCQLVIIALACIDLLSKVFSEQSFNKIIDMDSNKPPKKNSKKVKNQKNGRSNEL